MLEALKALFRAGPDPEEVEPPDPEQAEEELRLAACALLLELAYADDDFSDEERVHLKNAIRRQWDLNQEQTDALISEAERQRATAVDLWQFTTLIKRHYSLGQKVVLAEAMWGLVYSDGELSSQEDYLMRKICGLLDLKPGYLSAAKKRLDEGGGRKRETRID